MLKFLADFRKNASKLENVNLDAKPPSFWYSTGNYALNRIISGSYRYGFPQGRVTALAGPSDSGKSFLLTNGMRQAQTEGAYILAIDSENALDYNYLRRVGINITPERFQPVQVVTVQDVVDVLSDFVGLYLKDYGKYNPEAPKVFIGIDSLSMLLTETENENFQKGDQKGDQGQQAKQIKHFLKTMVSRMKMTNMTLVTTAHVYSADPLKGEGLYSVTPSLRYACSQIPIITKLKLNDEDAKGKKTTIGIRLKAETFKSRFSLIGSKVELEVPYDRGLDPMSGIVDRLVDDEVLLKGASGWYTLEYEGCPVRKFQEKQLTMDLVNLCLNHPKLVEVDQRFSTLSLEDDVEEQKLTEVTA
jgi:recombination protein RecA